MGVGGVKLIKIDGQMVVAVIGARADDEVMMLLGGAPKNMVYKKPTV